MDFILSKYVFTLWNIVTFVLGRKSDQCLTCGRSCDPPQTTSQYYALDNQLIVVTHLVSCDNSHPAMIVQTMPQVLHPYVVVDCDLAGS